MIYFFSNVSRWTVTRAAASLKSSLALQLALLVAAGKFAAQTEATHWQDGGESRSTHEYSTGQEECRSRSKSQLAVKGGMDGSVPCTFQRRCRGSSCAGHA